MKNLVEQHFPFDYGNLTNSIQNFSHKHFTLLLYEKILFILETNIQYSLYQLR